MTFHDERIDMRVRSLNADHEIGIQVNSIEQLYAVEAAQETAHPWSSPHFNPVVLKPDELVDLSENSWALPGAASLALIVRFFGS